jgi:hypothetical protein
MAAQYTVHGLELHRILLEDVPVTNPCKSMVFQDEKLAHWLYLLPMVFPSLLAANCLPVCLTCMNMTVILTYY